MTTINVSGELHVRDAGTAIYITLQDDGAPVVLSDLNEATLIIQGPTATRELNCTVHDSDNGILKAITNADTLVAKGHHRFQLRLSFVSWSGHSKVFGSYVLDVLQGTTTTTTTAAPS